ELDTASVARANDTAASRSYPRNMAGAGRKEITMKSWRIHLLATTAFLAAAALVLAGPASALRRSEEAFGAGPSGVPVSTPGGGDGSRRGPPPPHRRGAVTALRRPGERGRPQRPLSRVQLATAERRRAAAAARQARSAPSPPTARAPRSGRRPSARAAAWGPRRARRPPCPCAAADPLARTRR